MRERLRKSLGLCHEHAWLAADGMQGNALGLAILYEDIMRVVLEQLNRKRETAPHSNRGMPSL